MQPRRKPRVLLVDDDPRMLRAAKRWVGRNLDVEIVAVGDGPSAIALLESGEIVDAAVIDWDMPDMDGGAVIDQLHVMRPNLPCFVWTASACPSALPTQAPVLSKLQPEDLLGALRSALQRLTTRSSGLRVRGEEDPADGAQGSGGA